MAKLTTGRKPVALSSGYVTPLSSSSSRTQVITVVLSGWTILCFSNELELLWESNVNEYIPSSLYFSEASILVIPTPLRFLFAFHSLI